ncbi:hypothetical protein ACWEPC_42920, partial [Nonomuraea sp. NPDC004297]
MRRVVVLAGHNVLLRRRDPAHFVSYLIMPMVLMLIFKGMLDNTENITSRPVTTCAGSPSMP